MYKVKKVLIIIKKMIIFYNFSKSNKKTDNK